MERKARGAVPGLIFGNQFVGAHTLVCLILLEFTEHEFNLENAMKDNAARSEIVKRKQFSLLELLIVVGILGVLVTLVLPNFTNVQDDAREKVMKTEMQAIQAAFGRFSSDTGVHSDTTKLTDIADYGLWPLMDKIHPNAAVTTITYSDYDAETGIGRRGPYLAEEDEITIDAADLATIFGQAEDAAPTTSVTIPVVKDPYGGYYRVLMPSSGTDKEKNIALVCTGFDKTLNTTRTPNSEGDIEKVGDDTVIKLLPLATW